MTTEQSKAFERMAASNPVTREELEETITEAEVEAALVAAVERGERDRSQRGSTAVTGRTVRGLRGRTALGLGVGTACIGAITAAILLAGGSLGGPHEPTFADAAIEVAAANPRLLVTEPGWTVTRADEFETDSGEMNFSDGEHDLQITWYPARYYEQYLRDRADVSPPETSTLLGQTATTVHYGNGADYATMLAPQGEVFIEIRGKLEDKASYDAVLQSLRPVDVDTWLSAMPASVVQPVDRSATVDAMLRDIPLPPDFDVDALRSESSVLDRYHLGARVTGAVACEWLDRWVAATDAGDQTAADAAVEAMSTSRDWDILRDMADQGGWSQVVWEYSREIEQGRLDRGVAATEVRRDGTTFEFGPAYAVGLGCDSQHRRRVGD